MKYCQNCGAKINEDVVACPYCGHPVKEVVNEKEESPIFSILAIVFGALGGWLGLLFGIIGLATYKDPKYRKNCKIGIGLFIGWVVLYIILIIVVVTTTLSSISNMAFLPLQ